MKNMYCVIVGIVGLFALGPIAAAEAQTYKWTGFYVGGNLGYGSGSSDMAPLAWRRSAEVRLRKRRKDYERDRA